MSTKNGDRSKAETVAPAPVTPPPISAVNEAQTESPKTVEPNQELARLAKKILKGNSTITAMMMRSSVMARELGKDLIAAKKLVEAQKNSWMQWLKDNCRMEPRQAQKYMRLASRWDELVKGGHDPAKFSIDQNLAMLANPDAEIRGLSGEPAKASTRVDETDFRVSGDEELKEKRLLADELEPSESLKESEDKFVQSILDYVVRQVKKQVSVMKIKNGTSTQFDAVVLAIALLKKVRNELTPKAILKVAEPEPLATAKTPADPVPATQQLAKAI